MGDGEPLYHKRVALNRDGVIMSVKAEEVGVCLYDSGGLGSFKGDDGEEEGGGAAAAAAIGESGAAGGGSGTMLFSSVERREKGEEITIGGRLGLRMVTASSLAKHSSMAMGGCGDGGQTEA